MEKTTQETNGSVGYSSTNPEPASIKEDREEEHTLRSAVEYDLKEKVTPP